MVWARTDSKKGHEPGSMEYSVQTHQPGGPGGNALKLHEFGVPG